MNVPRCEEHDKNTRFLIVDLFFKVGVGQLDDLRFAAAASTAATAAAARATAAEALRCNLLNLVNGCIGNRLCCSSSCNVFLFYMVLQTSYLTIVVDWLLFVRAKNLN